MTVSTGADQVCAALLEEGVSVLFGHPGGAILPFYDALHRRPELRHILCRHEQAAAHAADGYARVTRGAGVCVATSGPGATNLVTGLATALMDSVPVVAITGQVARGVLGTFAFQETDILGVTTPVTKHGFLVRCTSEIGDIVREAFRIARAGRPGPVVIDIPKDVQAEAMAESSTSALARSAGPWQRSDARLQLRRLVRWLDEAERPLILAGRGVVLAGVESALARLAARADIPVATSLLALDAFSGSDERAVGMPGMHGTERANFAIQESDLVVGLGVRFDDRIIGRPDGFAPRARIVHVDVDATSIGRTVRADLGVVTELAEALPYLAGACAERRRPAWWRTIEAWDRHAAPPSDPIPATGPLGARSAIREVARRICATGGQVASDVGQHQMWLAQELGDLGERTHLTSGGLGTMGYALPAAMGAAIARPDRPTWVVAGDGGFQMNVQELATVVQEQLPLRIAVVDNGYLGMVRQWQERFYGRRYSASRMTGPDLVLIGAAYGIPTVRIDREEELSEGLDRVEATRGPAMVTLTVEPEENVYPMVPAGAALHEMVFAPQAVAR